MTDAGIAIDVVNVDALEVACDVLVLKYAQALHGVDRSVAERLGIDLTPELLPPDGFRFYRTDEETIGARAVIFVGVVPLREFQYRQIREFTTKALMALAGEAPDASHVVFTLHGVGYGLDEGECFLAELAGLIDATSSGDLPRNLQRITFAERNAGRVKRLSALLAKELPGAALEHDSQPLQQRLAREGSVLRSVGFASAEKALVFVAMPIDPDTEDRFHYGIERPVDAAGCLCERIDKTPGTGDLLDRIKAKINASTIVIADLTGSNPNVFLEVGYAWGIGTETILLASKEAISTLPFDVRTQTCLVYDGIQDLENKLQVTLEALLHGNKP